LRISFPISLKRPPIPEFPFLHGTNLLFMVILCVKIPFQPKYLFDGRITKIITLSGGRCDTDGCSKETGRKEGPSKETRRKEGSPQEEIILGPVLSFLSFLGFLK